MRQPFHLLDLFSGIGGFSLGLERSGGFKTVAFCEIEPFCRRVLAKHWPEVPCYDDIRLLTAERLAADGIAVDAICGGFPCQDISHAGRGDGIEGERSGLWREYCRLIGALHPRVVVVENVAALLGRGMGAVLGDLAALGYDAEWHCIPASYVGAPHRRDRVWILAYPAPQRSTETGRHSERQAERVGFRCPIQTYAASISPWAEKSGDGSGETRFGWSGGPSQAGRRFGLSGTDDWYSEPDVCRVVDGFSDNVDRDAALGNAVVPQIPELIGRAILAAEAIR